MGKTLKLTAEDGHELQAYRAKPAGVPRAGIVVVQEVFGVNSHIRAITDGFARDGYLALAPALFDRVERGVELTYGGDDLARGRALRTAIPWDKALRDVAAAAEAVRPAGKVGVVGYCWGGSVAWLAACRLAIAAAVGYYGGQIHEHRKERPRCPAMLHFGEADALIPVAQVDEIAALHPQVQVFLYPAGHGFNCDQRGDFHPQSAELARRRSLDFFGEHLG